MSREAEVSRHGVVHQRGLPVLTICRASPTELEPILTLRGHLEPVTSLVVSTPLSTIFSASIDSTIRVWRLPPPTQDPYAAWDPTWCVQTLEGHTDSVWDLCLLPPREIVPPGKKPSEGRLVSSSADGTVKLWRYDPDVSPGGQWKLSASWSFEGNVNPTCLGVCNTDFAKVLIGFYDGTVKVWDVEEGVEVQTFGESSDGEWSSRPVVQCHIVLCPCVCEGVRGSSGGTGRVDGIVTGARLTARRGRRAGQCRAQPSDTARHHYCAGEWADQLLRRKVL